MLKRPLVIGLFLSLAAVGKPAAADQSTAIEYRAPEQCPTREQFLHEVDRRLSQGDPLYELGRITVEIRPAAAGFAGQLHLHDGARHDTARHISGKDCSEVATALALIAALALQAKLAGEDEAPAAPAPRPAETPATPEAAPPPAAPSEISVGAHVGLASAYAPGPSGTVRAFIDATSGALSLRWWLEYATSLQSSGGLGQAHFDWLGTRGDLCGLSGAAGRPRLGLCGTLAIGYLRGKGEPTGSGARARSGGVQWLAPGLLGEFHLPLTAGLRLQFAGGVQFPLYREEFIFRRLDGTAERIHRVPGAGWLGSIGVAYPLR